MAFLATPVESLSADFLATFGNKEKMKIFPAATSAKLP